MTNYFLASEDLSKGDQDPCIANSSSPKIEPFDESYVESTMPITTVTTNGEQRVLGVHWNTVTDCLVFDF